LGIVGKREKDSHLRFREIPTRYEKGPVVAVSRRFVGDPIRQRM